MHRYTSRILSIVCLSFAPFIPAQSVPQQDNSTAEGLRQKDLVHRIFDGEHRTIALFAKQQPIVEVYAQSLDADATPESVVDDAYFLSRVSLDPDSERHRVVQAFAFGRTAGSRQVKTSAGSHWRLYPEGYVDMLFADVTDFDEDHYSLIYEARERLGNTDCLRMTVTPIEPKWSGQFKGNIWIETTNFRIVRLDGTFTAKQPGVFSKYLNPVGITTLGVYFHFDSRRQEVSPGVWMPAYTYFDDQLLWNQAKFTTSYHFRGYTSVWGYGEDAAAASASIGPAADPISQLQSDQLIATPGAVEHSLDGIVHGIRTLGHIAGPEIHCRILMTTPVELFTLGNNIVISRGLLNIVPNQSVLAVLLAREVAHIELGHGQGNALKITSVFDTGRTSDFRGFGFGYSQAEELAAKDRAAEFLRRSPDAAAIPLAERFEDSLADQSGHIRHLLQARFGSGLVERKTAHARPAPSPLPSLPDGLVLRADYGINSWDNMITRSTDLSIATNPKAAASASIRPPASAAAQ